MIVRFPLISIKFKTRLIAGKRKIINLKINQWCETLIGWGYKSRPRTNVYVVC